MRPLLSVLAALLAGALAALTLLGARAHDVVHTPEPLQQIAGPMAEDPELLEALPGAVADAVGEQLPEGLPGFLEDGVAELAAGATDGLVQDERFEGTWAQVLEESRTDWVDRLAAVHAGQGAQGQEQADGAGDAGTNGAGAVSTAPTGAAGTVHLHLDPLVGLGADRLADAVGSLPGGSQLSEGLRGAEGESTLLVADLGVPAPDVITPQQTAMVVHWLPQWPWLGAAAAAAALLGVLLAPRGRGWTVLIVAGLTAALAGLAAWWGLGQLSVDPAGATDLARAALDPLVTGLQNFTRPSALELAAGGGLIALLGIVLGVFARRSRAF